MATKTSNQAVIIYRLPFHGEICCQQHPMGWHRAGTHWLKDPAAASGCNGPRRWDCCFKAWGEQAGRLGTRTQPGMGTRAVLHGGLPVKQPWVVEPICQEVLTEPGLVPRVDLPSLGLDSRVFPTRGCSRPEEPLPASDALGCVHCAFALPP